MKFLRLTNTYQNYLDSFYRKRPNIKNEPYQKQYHEFMSDCFYWGDFWSQNLQKLGYETGEIVGNVESMQKAWAKENDVSYDQNNWEKQIIKSQVKKFKPDIIFLHDFWTYGSEFLSEIRNECSSIKFVIAWCGGPTGETDVWKVPDLILSCSPNIVQRFLSQGKKSEYFLHGFQASILGKIDLTQSKSIDFSFLGSLRHIGEEAHKERAQLLKKIVPATNIKIWSDVLQPPIEKVKSIQKMQAKYDIVKKIKSIPILSQLTYQIPKIKNYATMDNRPNFPPIYLPQNILERVYPSLFGIEMYQKIYESKLTWNSHIDFTGSYAANMRLYEATGVGTCLVTDWKDNLPKLFEPDQEVVTYRNVEECIEKVGWLLDNPIKREEIAKAGQARTLKTHTLEIRAEQLDQIIKRELSIT